jgi:hypothetical protein
MTLKLDLTASAMPSNSDQSFHLVSDYSGIDQIVGV